MTIQSSTIPASAAAGGTAAQPSGGTGVSENQFLQLLVAQMKHQDPTNPTDSTTFVTQLAQFSQLEQIVAIRGDLEKAIAQGIPRTTATGGH